MDKDILYPLRRLHGMMIDAKLRREQRRYHRDLLTEKKKHNPRTVYLVLTPEHTNLGDHAIASEEIRLLQHLGIDYIEITGAQLIKLKNQKLLGVMNKTPILINGGGNLGTLWFDVEQIMRDIVKANPKSPIFIMPNTIFYEDSDWGKDEFKRSLRLYNAHKKLTIYAREQVSYDTMKGLYRNVKLMPDMVLFRNECADGTDRKGCLLCLRNDLEKTIGQEERAILEEQVRGLFGDAWTNTDTHATKDVPIDRREAELEQKFSEFRSAELVITDRLHGMIFCAITGTPCIVLNSKSPKVRGCYEWIKDLPYIRFADSVSCVAQEYRKIPQATYRYHNEFAQPYYEKLLQDISSVFNPVSE